LRTFSVWPRRAIQARSIALSACRAADRLSVARLAMLTTTTFISPISSDCPTF
jgi:hypothetical protein